MREMKTADLIGRALDWAVLTAIEVKDNQSYWKAQILERPQTYTVRPSNDWSQGGPLIEQEAVSLTQFSDHPQWTAKHPSSVCFDGPTPLIAAMRCLVAAKLGATVQIPSELIQ